MSTDWAAHDLTGPKSSWWQSGSNIAGQACSDRSHYRWRYCARCAAKGN